ncbi:MAG TPA: FHA domain-containing serine/threonine-protein kinase [Gemmataceae bacterium]|nr:FHA domain-containing serine/threonine-protein kinase [Gemmataceae bacterium]
MGRQLVVIRGLERGRIMALENAGVLQIGCSQTLDVLCRFRDPAVARVHCEINVDGERVTVIDAATGSGTFLNGARITRQELQPGDVIRIGGTELRYVIGEDSRSDRSIDDPRTSTSVDVGSDTILSEPLSDPVSQPQVSAADILNKLVGKTLARYKIEVQLGAGHWGRVFRACAHSAEQKVALKVLCPEFGTNAETMGSFRDALKAVLPLRHPNLLLHYGAGKAGPFCWIAMEYVEGRSLTQVIRRASTTALPDWRLALQVGTQISRALVAIHARQVVHGHITPQNVMIRNGDKEAKLGDLMFARTLLHARRDMRTALPRRLDELAYVAPEGIDEREVFGVRADVYSLGATMYALLTGRPIFTGKTKEELAQKVRRTAPIEPILYQPSIPHAFQQIVLRMLSKQPRERFASAAELLPELERLHNNSR